MLEEHHPLKGARAPGCRLTYLLESSRFGILGGCSFVAAPMRLGPRDNWLLWSPRARGAHLAEVVTNDRFLILPGVRVKNLASHALRLVHQRLPSDWQEQCGAQPLLLETCVGEEQRGSCYEAAGWEKLGCTKGRPPGGGPSVPTKQVWVRPLVGEPFDERRRRWQTQQRSRSKGNRMQAEPSCPPPPRELSDSLCAEPERTLGGSPGLDLPVDADFAEREFGRSDLPDGRLRRRLITLGRAWLRCAGQPLTAIVPRPAAQRAAYRLLHNPRVQPADILQPHREALVERSRLHSTLLLVQGTTSLKFAGMRRHANGLGPLGERSNASGGLRVHAQLTFTEGGRPLGVNGLESWARPGTKVAHAQEIETVRWLRGLEEGVRLGRACPGARVIVVGDRQSEMWSLFEEQARHHEHAGLLVRVNRVRQRRVHDRQEGFLRLLFDQMDFLPTLVEGRKLEIDSRGGKHARARRTAVTDIQAGWVELPPPHDRPDGRPLRVLAVRAQERDWLEREWPLEWVLLSSEGQATAQWAERIVGWYEGRWGIEEWFRVLKSGMRVEDHKLCTAESLQCCLAFDAINAWRVFELQLYAREAPATPATVALSSLERQVIWTYVVAFGLLPSRERGQPPPEDIRSWVVMLARIVGWQPRKRRRLPGNEVFWRAWQTVQQGVRLKEAEQAVARSAEGSP